MRWLAVLLLVPAPCLAARPLSVNTYAAAGAGYPELVRAEAGMFLSRRFSVELVTGLPTPELVTDFPTLPALSDLNIMVGGSFTGWFVGYCDGMRPPVNSMLVSVGARLNVAAPLALEADGVQLGPTAEIMMGYGLMTADDLFVVRAQVGVMMYADNGFGIGPNIVATVGKAFK